jgi:hypothetical protein
VPNAGKARAHLTPLLRLQDSFRFPQRIELPPYLGLCGEVNNRPSGGGASSTSAGHLVGDRRQVGEEAVVNFGDAKDLDQVARSICLGTLRWLEELLTRQKGRLAADPPTNEPHNLGSHEGGTPLGFVSETCNCLAFCSTVLPQKKRNFTACSLPRELSAQGMSKNGRAGGSALKRATKRARISKPAASWASVGRS